MKIRFYPEAYYAQQAPSLTKELMWGFYNRLQWLWLAEDIDEIKTLDVRVNQALSYMPIHFYVTVNGKHKYHFDSGNFKYELNMLNREPEIGYRTNKKWEWLLHGRNPVPKNLVEYYKRKETQEWEQAEIDGEKEKERLRIQKLKNTTQEEIQERIKRQLGYELVNCGKCGKTLFKHKLLDSVECNC